MGRVKGKVALVTGARRGLGAAIAVMLAKEGAKVAISDRKADGSESVLQKIWDAGGEAIFVEHDVSSEDSWEKAITAVTGEFGRLDILVNNAGVGAGENIEAITLEDWRWVMSINLDGTFLGTQKAIEAMKATGGGSIVNISSIEGLVGDRRMVAYDASKGGIVMLSRSAALHCARNKYNIRINTMHPGFIDTKMVQEFLKAISEDGDVAKARKELEDLHPLGHLGEHAAAVRENVCRNAEWLGVKLDPVANEQGRERISAPESSLPVFVIPTDEDLMIARHAVAVLRGVPRPEPGASRE